MRIVKRVVARGLNLFLHASRDREMNREIDAHLRLLQDEFERKGMDPASARTAALRSFGSLEGTRESHREARSFMWAEQSLKDLRYAVRGLLRTPGFTTVAVLTLALAIGVNTALFTVYNSVALKSFPVHDAARVVRFERWFESHSQGRIQYAFSWPEFDYVRTRARGFRSLVAASWLAPVNQAKTAASTVAQFVSPNYFDALGVPLQAGRGFLADGPGERAIVVSARYWHRALGSDPGIVGHSLPLDGAVVTVIGITSESFTGTSVNPGVPDFWAPLSLQPVLMRGQSWFGQPTRRTLQILGRLDGSASTAPAQTEAELLIQQFATVHPDTDRTVHVTLPHTSYFPNVDDLRFRALAAGVMLIGGLILFVACANIGNMLLARGAARQREISSRMALGASAGRIVRQLLTESVVLASLGGAAGFAASLWTTRLLALELAANASLVGGDVAAVDLTPDFRVLIYAALISLASAVLFGLSPALRLASRDVASALKSDAGATGNSGRSRLRAWLMGAQVAVSIFLLASAGLLVRGMLRARNADTGFDSRGVFVLNADPGSYDDSPTAMASLKVAVAEKLRGRSEIDSVSIGGVPFTGTWTPPAIVDGAQSSTLGSYASHGYFETLGIAIVRGRDFTPAEGQNSAPLALVSESTARRLWPGKDPLGRQFTLDMNFKGQMKTFEVIGLVRDVRYSNLTRPDPAHVYIAGPGPASTVLIRSKASRETVARVFANLPESLVRNARALNLDDSFIAPMRRISDALAAISAALALLAVAIAGIGIFGVVSFLVGQRTREIGVRMALGANTAGILKGAVVQTLRPALVGSVCGIAMAACFSATLNSTLRFPGSFDLFYGVPFYDPVTFGAIVLFAALLAITASAVPARRAFRIDPASALRYE